MKMMKWQKFLFRVRTRRYIENVCFISGIREVLEKDERGVSTLYSLADFVDEDGSRIRKGESYERNYLIGKYGAIPTLRSIDIFNVTKSDVYE